MSGLCALVSNNYRLAIFKIRLASRAVVELPRKIFVFDLNIIIITPFFFIIQYFRFISFEGCVKFIRNIGPFECIGIIGTIAVIVPFLQIYVLRLQ